MPGSRRIIALTGTALAVQFALGVITLLFQVPVTLGVLHQAGALLLFAALIHCLFWLRRQPLQEEARG